MKCAWMFSDNADLIARVKANYRQESNTLGIVASVAAYNEGGDWLDQLVTVYRREPGLRGIVYSRQHTTGEVGKSQGTYLAWLDVSAVEDKIGAKETAAEANRNNPSKKPITPEMVMERWFVQNAKVQINAGSNYGLGGSGHMRMNLATSRKTLEMALNNMASALKKT